MSNNRYFEEFPDPMGEGSHQETKLATQNQPADSTDHNRLLSLWDQVTRAGLGEIAFRAGTHLLSVALILAVLWAMRALYVYMQSSDFQAQRSAQGVLAAPLLAEATEANESESSPPEVALPPFPALDEASFSFEQGIPRQASLHTIILTRPRTEVITYTVEKGDTLFGIAEKFNLKPETLLWGNVYTLGDNPHALRPGQILNILPADGVYHKWSVGESLTKVAEVYGVEPEEIIGWPGNHLDAAVLGDLHRPNIEAGTMLFVPGGHRAFVTWSAPPGLTRQNPAAAKIMGPGYCGSIVDGAIGTGAFIWPTTSHWISGYDYAPGANHSGIDIGGREGNAIFAADNGVIVYSGWNNWGYGNVVVIDHGNGWQTLYAHMSSISVGCGQSVYQGNSIGAVGSTGNSTGPHLHFEMIYEGGRVNPHDFLPAP